MLARRMLPPIWQNNSGGGYDAVRILAALVLFVAALLKGYQLSTEPVIGQNLLESRGFLMAVVEFELFFALWLVFGPWPRQTWAAALGLFALFTCVSLYKALAGHASCGCFGRVPVNPWLTSALDLTLVLSLLRWRPHLLPSPFGRGAGGEGLSSSSPRPVGEDQNEGLFSMSPRPLGEGQGEGSIINPPSPSLLHHSAFIIPVLLWLSLGIPAAFAMSSYTDTTLSDAGEIIGDGKTVVLEPEKWIGKRFPLLDYIDIGDKLKEGSWVVVLYHHDCPKCKEAMPKYEELGAVRQLTTGFGFYHRVDFIVPVALEPVTPNV